MHIVEVEHGLDLSKPTVGYVRSPGLHMSDIYNKLYKLLDPKRYDKRDENGDELPFSKLHAELGTAFEESLEEALEKRLLGDRPGEFRTRHAKTCPRKGIKPAPGRTCWCGAGIYYSPDYLIVEEGGNLRLGEFKATWRSLSKGIRDPKFDKWFCQMMAYSYHMDLTDARLYAFFVIEDRTKWQPTLKAWDIEFSQKELNNNWDMLLRFAQKHEMLEAA